MTALVEWFCDFGNRGRQRRDPGDEVNTGYARTPLDTTPPDGWFEVRMGDELLPQGGHGCGQCAPCRTYLERIGVVTSSDTDRSRPDAGLPGASQRKKSSAWPSVASPFADAGAGLGGTGGVHDG